MKYNVFNRKPDVEMLKSINVSDIEWCDEAVLIRVKNGKGTLAHRISEEDEDYTFFSQLLLDDKPIIQGKYPICPTCAGMLATGYGIENINSEELIKVRECMNTEYKGIKDAAESIKPLLGLLRDGYYVLADVKLYPSDGQVTYNEASCSEYYDLDFLCSVEGYPAYIYPTQSSELIHEERVDEYIQIMKNGSNLPRGLAYRAKLFALFNKANYQKEELKYFCDETLGEDIMHFAKIIRRFDAWSASKYFYALKIVENELDSLLEKGSTKWEENSLENLVQIGENIDEPCWNLNQSDAEMSLRDIEKIVGIRQLWDNLCNCGCILEDIGKEWFLPTYIGIITSDE